MKKVLVGVGIALFIFSAGGMFALLENTLVSRGWFFMVVAMVAIASGVALRNQLHKVTYISNVWINIAIWSVFATAVLGFGALAVNFFTADFDASSAVHPVVERKLVKTRYRSNRSGRHSYSRGAPYKVYFLGMEPEKGCDDDFQVTKQIYDSVTVGDTVVVRTGRGLLGMKVVETRNIKPLHPRKMKRQRKCRFFGTSSRGH